MAERRVRGASAVALLALGLLALPLLTNLLSGRVPPWLTNPVIVLPVTIVVLIVVITDQLRRRVGPTSDGRSLNESLFKLRLLRATEMVLAGMQRGSIDTEAAAHLGEFARVPLTLVAAGDSSDNPLTDLTDPQELTQSVVELKGGLSLVLTGEPGSGKTTFIRDLARAMIEAAKGSNPDDRTAVFPVWVDAGLWRPGIAFEEYLRTLLRERSSLPADALGQWLGNGQIYLIIDNISWLTRDHRKQFIRQLNQFRAAHQAVGMLIAANEETVTADGATIDLPKLIIEKLSPRQVLYHLALLGDTHSVIYETAKSSPELVEVMRTRLFFTVALLAFPNSNAPGIQRLRSSNPRDAIVEAYIDSLMLRRERAGALAERTASAEEGRQEFLRHLGWIAKNLVTWNTFYFRDYLNVAWVPGSRRRRVLRLTLGALNGTLAALGTAVILVPRSGMTGFAIAASLFVIFVIVRLPDVHFTDVEPVRKPRLTIKWSLKEFRQELASLYSVFVAVAILLPAYLLSQYFSRWSALSGGQQLGVLVMALVSWAGIVTLAVLLGTKIDFVDTMESWVVVSPRSPARFLLSCAKWSIYAAVSVLVIGFMTLAVFRLAPIALSSTNRPGMRPTELASLLAPVASTSIAIALVALVVVFVWRVGFLIEVMLVDAVLRDAHLIPEDFSAFLERASRLSLLQRYGGDEYVFNHQIFRDFLARHWSDAAQMREELAN